jgi:hypothetical protein
MAIAAVFMEASVGKRSCYGEFVERIAYSWMLSHRDV